MGNGEIPAQLHFVRPCHAFPGNAMFLCCATSRVGLLWFTAFSLVREQASIAHLLEFQLCTTMTNHMRSSFHVLAFVGRLVVVVTVESHSWSRVQGV